MPTTERSRGGAHVVAGLLTVGIYISEIRRRPDLLPPRAAGEGDWMARHRWRMDSIDPCRLARQVNEILQLQPGNLIHLPTSRQGSFFVFFGRV